MKRRLPTFLLVLTLLLGFSFLLYPTASDYWNSFHQTRAIADYAEQVETMEDNDYEELWKEAEEYNQFLLTKKVRWEITEEEREQYNSLLDVSGNGIIGYIEIPKIKTDLPVYHGVDAAVLQIAIGHIEGSSLPIGGDSTHAVLSGHRGLPSAKLFTNLDQLEAGDVFMLRILDQTLTYEVDQIRIVEPDDFRNLQIEEGKDYCTLVTCTPYGVNSHRLLVRGKRTANTSEARNMNIVAEATQVDPRLVALFLGAVMTAILLIGMLFWTRDRK